jgi:hypothetical protein
MGEHDCIHENDFGTLFTKIENLITTVTAQTNVISDLIKFQASLQGVEKYKEKESMSTRQRASIYVSAIIGFSAIITSIILKML